MAMQGFVTYGEYRVDECARLAVLSADALIAELNK